MKVAWFSNTEFDLEKICCNKMRKNPIMQQQNKHWYLFNTADDMWDIIEYCPFCGKKLKIGVLK